MPQKKCLLGHAFARLKFILPAVVAASGISVAAQADDLLGLWEVAQIQDAAYLSATHKYLAEQEGVIQSRADLLPTLSFQYEHKHTHQDIKEADNAVFAHGSDTYPTITYGFTATQSVFDYARWQRYSQSKISSNKGLVEFTLAKQQLLLRLAESYFLVLERTDQLETIQAEKTAMEKYLETAVKKHSSGIGSRTDVEDSRARFLSALSKEAELESRLMDSEYALREVTGSLPTVLSRLRVDVKPVIPNPQSAEAWVNVATERNLELQAMTLAVEAAKKDVKSLRGAHLPTLDLVYRNNNTNTDGSTYGGGSVVDSADIALQLNVPLYSGGRASSKVRQALEAKNSLGQDLIQKRRSIERSIHDAYFRIQTAIAQIAALEQSVIALKKLLNSKMAGYRVGRSGILETLDVEQDLSTAQQVLTKARYDYILNVLRLKYYAGSLGETDLRVINTWLVSTMVGTLGVSPLME